jgi:hypothetical protein
VDIEFDEADATASAGRRVHPPTAHTPIPPNQKIAIFGSSIITIKTPIKT